MRYARPGCGCGANHDPWSIVSRRAHLVRLLSAALLVLVLLPLRPATADVPTQAGDTLRTAWDAAEPALSPSAVASSSFGKLFATRVDGQVYAQPLVVRNTVVAVTERDKAYGLDPVTGAVRWRRDLGQPWSASMLGCGDLAPDVGVTSTPVYDPATDSVVLLAKVVPAGADVQHPQWQAHALDPVTGAERDGYPVTVAGAPSNDPAHPFSPLTASQRVGLLLLDGRVYAGFGAHCDHGPYVGYVVGIGPGVGTGRPGVTGMWASETAAYGEGGIWQSGGGLVSDGPGHILLATGNGISPPPSPGTTPPSTLGESVVRLQVAADGTLAARDFFSPANNAKLDQDDADLGSGAPLALPDGYGTTAVPHLLVQVGKDGRTYLLDRDHLGGMGQGPGGTDAALGVYGPYGPVWGKPAFFGGGGGYVYVPEAYGVLRAFHLSRSASGQPALSVAGTSAGQLHFGSSSPVVTSSGTDPRSALVWEVYLPAGNGVGAQLRAYDALPVAGVLQQRFAYDIGTGAKFSSVAADGGRVYVGTRDGLVWGFGTPTTASLTGAVTDFGQLPVDVTATRDVTLTATRDVTVISVTASAPFSAASGGFALSAGATRTLPVQVTAATPGAASGSLTLGTATGETVVLPLQVIATRPGLVAQPAALDLGEVPVGAAREGGTSLTNTGTAPVTVVASSVDGSPGVRVTGLPPAGTVLSPQESVAVGVHAEPAAAGAVLATLRLSSDAGGGYASIAVPVKATAVAGQARMTLPPALDLGQVPVGLSASGSFDLRNDGNITMRVTKAKPPAGAFTTATPLPEGLVVPPGETVHQEVTFRPASEGPVSESYLITADDGSGAQTVLLRGAGVSDPIAVEYAARRCDAHIPVGQPADQRVRDRRRARAALHQRHDLLVARDRRARGPRRDRGGPRLPWRRERAPRAADGRRGADAGWCRPEHGVPGRHGRMEPADRRARRLGRDPRRLARNGRNGGAPRLPGDGRARPAGRGRPRQPLLGRRIGLLVARDGRTRRVRRGTPTVGRYRLGAGATRLPGERRAAGRRQRGAVAGLRPRLGLLVAGLRRAQRRRRRPGPLDAARGGAGRPGLPAHRGVRGRERPGESVPAGAGHLAARDQPDARAAVAAARPVDRGGWLAEPARISGRP